MAEKYRQGGFGYGEVNGISCGERRMPVHYESGPGHLNLCNRDDVGKDPGGQLKYRTPDLPPIDRTIAMKNLLEDFHIHGSFNRAVCYSAEQVAAGLAIGMVGSCCLHQNIRVYKNQGR